MSDAKQQVALAIYDAIWNGIDGLMNGSGGTPIGGFMIDAIMPIIPLAIKEAFDAGDSIEDIISRVSALIPASEGIADLLTDDAKGGVDDDTEHH